MWRGFGMVGVIGVFGCGLFESTGRGPEHCIREDWSAYVPKPDAGTRWLARDFDGDGREEVAVVEPTRSALHVEVVSSIDVNEFRVVFDGSEFYGSTWHIMDADGDTRLDLVGVTDDQLFEIVDLRGTPRLTTRYVRGVSRMAPVDYDGDGYTDAVGYRSLNELVVFRGRADGEFEEVSTRDFGDVPVCLDEILAHPDANNYVVAHGGGRCIGLSFARAALFFVEEDGTLTEVGSREFDKVGAFPIQINGFGNYVDGATPELVIGAVVAVFDSALNLDWIFTDAAGVHADFDGDGLLETGVAGHWDIGMLGSQFVVPPPEFDLTVDEGTAVLAVDTNADGRDELAVVAPDGRMVVGEFGACRP